MHIFLTLLFCDWGRRIKQSFFFRMIQQVSMILSHFTFINDAVFYVFLLDLKASFKCKSYMSYALLNRVNHSELLILTIFYLRTSLLLFLRCPCSYYEVRNRFRDGEYMPARSCTLGIALLAYFSLHTPVNSCLIDCAGIAPPGR
jgi:hypothetical protein